MQPDRRLKKELNSIDWRAGAYATKFLTRTVCQWFLVSLRVSDWLFFILSSLYKPRDKGISLMLIYSNFMKSNRGILIFSLSKILAPPSQPIRYESKSHDQVKTRVSRAWSMFSVFYYVLVGSLCDLPSFWLAVMIAFVLLSRCSIEKYLSGNII